MTAAAARFAAQWAAVAPHEPVGLAVSGGPDSLAMLLLFHEVAPRNFQVATVDHGLRAESADEAAMVAAICAERAIAHRTLALSLEKGNAVQERARAARYAALAQWARDQGLAAIVTAHHADDQAETMLMRLNRGVGLRGLAAMRPVAQVPGAPGLALLRPLLSWRRAELQAVVDVAGLAAADDPSIRDLGYLRVRVRDVRASRS
ncbi:MAG: tRNA lysidine(34) synthetase TilS, partial [Novosphingobium sp.]